VIKERIQSRGRLPPSEAIGIARQVLSALAAAHARGLVHRDVKPQNVLLTTDGVVKLADFGIVHVPAQAELTMQGTTIGTAAYIAPEQATGGTVGPQADVYAVGLLLYEMLAGRPPFVGGSSVEILVQHLNRPVPSLAPRCPEAPFGLVELIERMLEKDYTARPSANDIQAVPFSSVTICGSIAFQFVTPGTDWMTLPWSSHLKRGSARSSVTLVATPMQEVFLPNADTE
jgi:serine/threonine-protein kinase